MEGTVSTAGGLVVPVLAVDQIETQTVSAVWKSTGVRMVSGPVCRSAVTVAITAGENDLEPVVYIQLCLLYLDYCW